MKYLKIQSWAPSLFNETVDKLTEFGFYTTSGIYDLYQEFDNRTINCLEINLKDKSFQGVYLTDNMLSFELTSLTAFKKEYLTLNSNLSKLIKNILYDI
jgi:hypothetical protein